MSFCQKLVSLLSKYLTSPFFRSLSTIQNGFTRSSLWIFGSILDASVNVQTDFVGKKWKSIDSYEIEHAEVVKSAEVVNPLC